MKDNNDLKGLGGWLILVGFKVVKAPITILFTLISIFKPIFEDGTWEALTTTSSEFYNPYFRSLYVVEITYNAVIFAASIYLIHLFFSKHYLFPKIFIFLAAASLIFIPLDAWLATKVFPDEKIFDPEMTKEFMRFVFASVVWVPYMLVSKRVSATFVERKPNEQMQPAAESVD